MEAFKPEKIFYERGSQQYPQGRVLLEKYAAAGVPAEEIENHNNIPALRAAPDSDFMRLKKYLVLGVRKSLKFVPNEKTSDFLVPYTSSGCPAMCQYCYLVCNYFKCAYLRVFVNRREMMQKMIDTAEKSDAPLTFEIGSNSDLIIENTVTGNLPWTIESFAHVQRGFLTFPTKFHMVDDLLPLRHNGHTIVRMSVNPEYIVRHVEIGTSPLEKRLEALIKLHRAGYPVGLLIAPVILMEDWERMYEELIIHLKDALPPDLKRILKIEVIVMTYGYVQRAIHDAAFKGAADVYDAEKMRPSGRGKYRYKTDIAQHAREVMHGLIEKHLSECTIAYIC